MNLPEKPHENKPEEIPPDEISPKGMQSIKESWYSRKSDVTRKIALVEMGLVKRLTEDDIAHDLGISRQQLAVFKRNNRNTIEAFKEDIRSSKYNLMKSINERMMIASAFAQATLASDDVLAHRCKKVLGALERILPLNQLQTIGNILEKLDGVAPDDPSVGSKIQINVNNSVAEAEKLLEERRKAKQIDV